jgi:hypothetical protein
MRPETPEACDSPLEEVLASLPEEEPPANLEQRCLGAVRDLDSRARFARRRGYWKPVVIAAAAGLVFTLLGVSSLQSLLPSGRANQALSNVNQLRLSEAPAPATTPAAPANTVLGGTGRDSEALSPSPPPGGPGAAGGAEWGTTQAGAGAAPAAKPLSQLPKARPGTQEEYARDDTGADTQAAEAPPPVLGLPSYPSPSENGPERPWRDTSPDRQKITHAILSLLVKDVQEAYDEAKSVIEDAKGYIEQEDLRLEKEGKHEAHLSARVPVDKLRGVLAQLRDLGQVTVLKSEDQDVTREYRARGAGIRDMGATEDELVRRYEAAKDKQTKRRLYEQIMNVRASNQASKSSLSQLSDKTHMAFLELTLTEKTTPLKFLGSVADHMGVALGWVAATAVIWLPLLVLALVVRRRNGAGSAS